MKNKGFTLIELLIVVLIIGILAAVALPQYQITVDKSRYATLMPMAKSLATAQEGFFLTNSKYSQDLGSLDVELPNSPSGLQATLDNGIEVTLSDVKNYNYVKMKKEGLDNYYLLYQDKSYNYAGEQHCEALATSERANRLCKALGGRELDGNTTAGYKTYILEGDGNGTTREVPSVGSCTVNAVEGCVRYSYMNGSGYEEFRQITSTYERNTHRDYDENGHFTHQQSVYDSGKVIDWDFNAEGYNIYQKTHNEDGQVVEIWKDDNGIRTHGKVELTNGSIEEAFWNPDGTYNHYTASWYDQDNDKVRFYNEYGSFNADGTQNSIQTKYWEDGSVRGYYPFLFNGSSNTDVGIGMEYNRDGSLATSVESGETGGYIAHYEYNSDGTYVRKPEETKDDSSTWTYGTYTTGTNGDVTRSDGVTISGSGNYPTLCQSHPDLPQCN